MSDQRVPKGRLGRLRRMAGVGLRVGANSVLGRGDGGVTAEKASEVLGQLRGVAAKVGQMAGYVDGVVPDEKRDAYQKWMKRLMDQAPTSSADQVRETVEGDLGKPIEELYAEFDMTPVASASIGQVHRARTTAGEDVAVKVQHYRIDRAVEADLSNAGLLEGAFKMFAGRKFESDRILEEIRERFREELDYELEAQRQRRFGEVFKDAPKIIIPRVHDSLSSRRVLTTDFVSGLKLDDAAQATPDERRAWAETMWQFVYEGTLVGGLFNADPHPGNYFFAPDGAVNFLDFGCVQDIVPERRPIACQTHRAACVGDRAGFDRLSAEMMDLRGGRYQERAVEYLREAFRPQFDSPFHITSDYVAGLAKLIKEVFDVSRKDRGDDYVAFPPGVFFLNRLQFGFYSVLARLDVPADYAGVELGFLADDG